MKKTGTMILLTVRTFDLRKVPPKEGEFDRAWFRITNEETNQTLDYKIIKDIEKPEGFDEDAPIDEEQVGDDGEPLPRTEAVYVAGRIFLDQSGKWIYESYNNCFTSDRLPNLSETLGDLYKRSEEEVKY